MILQEEYILTTAPQLTVMPSGDGLELHPSGSWTAAYATVLEALFGTVAAQLGRSKTLRLDLRDVRELDTLGAWLLEDVAASAVRRSSCRCGRRSR